MARRRFSVFRPAIGTRAGRLAIIAGPRALAVSLRPHPLFASKPLSQTPLKALLLNDAALLGHHGSALVTEQIVRLARAAGITVAHGWSWDAGQRALAARHPPFDLVLVNGEGSIHSSSRSSVRIAALARDLARGPGPPGYLINATIEGNTPDIDAALGGFRLRFVRDSKSRATLARAGVAAEVVHDLTLSAAHLPRAQGTGALLVTDASDQGKTRRLMAVADRIADAQILTLRTAPPWPARGSPSRRIGFLLKRTATRLAPPSPRSLRYAGALTREAFVARLARGARGILCGRYHAACIAIRMSLPFVAVEGNTSKTSALLEDIGLAERLVSLDALERAGEGFDVPAFSDAERARIAAFLANVEQAASQMFGRIADDARAAQAVRV